MEFLGLALLMFLGRLTVDIIATVKGTTPPHLQKARLRAEQRRLAAERNKPPRERSPYASGKPTLGDVAAVYWGDAMTDVIASHDRRRAEKQQLRDENARAAAEDRPTAQVRPGWAGRIKRFAKLLWNGPEPADAQAPDPAAAVSEALTPPAEPSAEPRIACDDCGATLIDGQGGHAHPAGSTCRKAWPPEEAPLPRPVDEVAPPGPTTQASTPAPVQPQPEERPEISDDNEGDDDMTTPTASTATGDAHDLESASHQCDLLGDDLTRIDTSLDIIDEAISSAGTATELIEEFLRSKNADDATVGGMSTAREMLSPDRIKALIDAMSAAKQGVKDTKDALDAMNEGATEALRGADGSIVNGR